jgi:hypothetical protein
MSFSWWWGDYSNIDKKLEKGEPLALEIDMDHPQITKGSRKLLDTPSKVKLEGIWKHLVFSAVICDHP